MFPGKLQALFKLQYPSSFFWNKLPLPQPLENG
jgi:hypothetical protein